MKNDKMTVTEKRIALRDLVDGFAENGEKGVVAYGGRLDVQPPYQRAFIYDGKQQEAVIKTVMQGRPLNAMYWSRNNAGGLEILDGQQRTMSICRFHADQFVSRGGEHGHYFSKMPAEEKQAFLDYELTVHFCEGGESEKLAWFKTVNIAGEKLLHQEIRNAAYAGPFVSAAKLYFSKKNGEGHRLGEDYIKGDVDRQLFLQRAIEWHIGCAQDSHEKIDDFMSEHRTDESAEFLIAHYKRVIEWVKHTFGEEARGEMRGINWGFLYKEYGKGTHDPVKIQKRVDELMCDDDVTQRSGIYHYVLSGKQHHLSIRTFDKRDKNIKPRVWEKQGKKCANPQNREDCEGAERLELKDAHADHKRPWSKGGKTEESNCQVLCRHCNLTKSDK